ncbi:MAG: dihydrodipicolinate synthase family protein, partial [Planctomycetota bacterium]|nr:dihydrodipicolinate synthase family protein [Planctomycetota bacterium]
AVREAEFARECGYHAGLLSVAALKEETIPELIDHCRKVAEVIPVFGFYLQPAVGGRLLPYPFWRDFASIENVIGIKMAPFNRYQTIDVIRGVCESDRSHEIALYTGNDDNIVADLLTEYRVKAGNREKRVRIVGGLLGHWACWTKGAVDLLDEAHALIDSGGSIPPEWLTRNIDVTDANAAFFDVANGFAGCIAGIHEVLRRQGLLKGTWCLNPKEKLSPGQSEEIDRVYASYPEMNDDAFVAQNLDRWLA